MSKAIRFHEPGGPEVLKWEDEDVGAPGEGQIKVRHTAVGLNYIDTYHRAASTRCRCPRGSAWKGPAWSRRLGLA